jgi:hypothetical protein
MGRPASIRDKGQTLSEISAATGLTYQTLVARYRKGLRGKKLREGLGLRPKPQRKATPKPSLTQGAAGERTMSIMVAVPHRELLQWDALVYHYNKRKETRGSLNEIIRAAMSLLVAHGPK